MIIMHILIVVWPQDTFNTTFLLCNHCFYFDKTWITEYTLTMCAAAHLLLTFTSLWYLLIQDVVSSNCGEMRLCLYLLCLNKQTSQIQKKNSHNDWIVVFCHWNICSVSPWVRAPNLEHLSQVWLTQGVLHPCFKIDPDPDNDPTVITLSFTEEKTTCHRTLTLCKTLRPEGETLESERTAPPSGKECKNVHRYSQSKLNHGFNLNKYNS